MTPTNNDEDVESRRILEQQQSIVENSRYSSGHIDAHQMTYDTLTANLCRIDEQMQQRRRASESPQLQRFSQRPQSVTSSRSTRSTTSSRSTGRRRRRRKKRTRHELILEQRERIMKVFRGMTSTGARSRIRPSVRAKPWRNTHTLQVQQRFEDRIQRRHERRKRRETAKFKRLTVVDIVRQMHETYSRCGIYEYHPPPSEKITLIRRGKNKRKKGGKRRRRKRKIIQLVESNWWSYGHFINLWQTLVDESCNTIQFRNCENAQGQFDRNIICEFLEDARTNITLIQKDASVSQQEDVQLRLNRLASVLDGKQTVIGSRNRDDDEPSPPRKRVRFYYSNDETGV